MSYLVPQSSRSHFRSKSYKQIFEELLDFEDFGNPKTQYADESFSVDSSSEIEIETDEVLEKIMEGRKRTICQMDTNTATSKLRKTSGKYGTRSKTTEKESNKDFFKRAALRTK